MMLKIEIMPFSNKPLNASKDFENKFAYFQAANQISGKLKQESRQNRVQENQNELHNILDRNFETSRRTAMLHETRILL